MASMRFDEHSFYFSSGTSGIEDILGDEMYINQSMVSLDSFAPEDMTGSGSSMQRHPPQWAIESTNFGSRYHRENTPASLRTRSTYPRENDSTTSTSRSSYYWQHASGRSRTNSSNSREFVSGLVQGQG